MSWLARLLRRPAAEIAADSAMTPPPAPEQPPRRGIDYRMALGMLADSQRGAHKVYEPMKGVLPPGRKIAQDDSIMEAVNWGNAAQTASAVNLLGSAFAEGMIFPGYPYLSELAQRPEYRRGAEIWAMEMTRQGITFGSKKDGDGKAERIDALLDAMNRFKVMDTLRRLIELDGFMGRAHLFLDVGAKNLASPLLLTPRTVKRGSLRALRIVEPMWVYPAEYNSADPLAPDFYRPPSWFVMGQEVSATRLMTFVGREVPDLLKPSYAFGGLSLSQMAKPYVDNWLRTRQSVSDLIDSFSQMVMSTDLGSQAGADCSGDALLSRIEFFNKVRNNRGTMVLDKDTETLANVAAPLSGLYDLQNASLEQVCAVFGLPQVIYLQMAPSGMNASLDGVIRTFYDAVHSKQEDSLRDLLKRILDLIQLSEFGDIDEDITFEFNPLWQMSDKEKAEIRKINADTEAVYISAGVIDPVEVREALAADPDGAFTNIDPNKVPEVPGLDDMDPGVEEGQEAEGGGDNAA